MKDYKRNCGWRYLLQGGPQHGVLIRPNWPDTPVKKGDDPVDPRLPPPDQIRYGNHPSGRYVAKKLEGKRVKHKAMTVEAWAYFWEEWEA